MAALLAGAALAAVTLWIAVRPSPPAVARFSIVPPPEEPLRLETNHPDLVVSADGSRIVYWNRVGNENRLLVRPLDRFESMALTNLGRFPRSPFLSPDGAWIGFYYGETAGIRAGLAKVAVTGGAAIEICAVDSNLRGAVWGPDDTIVFATMRPATGLWRVRASGGAPEVLTRPAEADDEVDHRWPSLLPGGRHVLFEIARRGADPSDIGLLDLEARTWKVLIKGGTAPRYVRTGHIVYGYEGTLRAVAFDLESLSIGGDPVRVIDRVVVKGSGAADFSVSDTGTLVYVPGGSTGRDAVLAWVDRAGVVSPLGAQVRAYRTIALSPDGRHAAVTIEDPNPGVWIYDLERGSLTQLTSPEFVAAYWPVWSPDGRAVAFAATGKPGQMGGVFQMDARGVGAAQRLLETERVSRPLAWTLAGIVLQVPDKEGATDLALLTLQPKPQLNPLVAEPGFDAGGLVSPDGKWIAHQSSGSRGDEVFVRPFPNVNDDRITVSTAGGFAPFWSRDGRELFYLDTQDVLHVVNVTPGSRLGLDKPRKVLGPMELAIPRGFSISPDGKRFLVAQQTEAGASEIRVVVNWFEELKALMGAR
jgi:serine/threonine-protein kinase